MSICLISTLDSHYIPIITFIFVITVGIAITLYANNADWKITLTVLGGLVSFIYFVQKQQLDEAKFVNELFVKFNQRYDELNEKLNEIRLQKKSAKDFEPHEKDILFDYFNLCGEEYLFHRKGYIYPEVWKSWVAGMKIFYDDNGIQELWLEELDSESYYGLNVEQEIKKLAQKKIT